jgi:hypothetical protein
MLKRVLVAALRHFSMVTLEMVEIPCSSMYMVASLRRQIGREEFDYAAL